MNNPIRTILYTVAVLIAPFSGVAQASLDFEGGFVGTGYNNVQIPGDKGTRLSLKNDLRPQTELFYRIRMGYTINNSHTISALYAPLDI